MSGFSTEWLDLREPLDLAARDRALLRRAAAHLPANGGVVVDLGSGTGSTYRAFASIGAGTHNWHLVDNDSLLLAEAARRCGPAVRTHCADLRQFDALPLDRTNLVTASALLDLCSEDWIEGLAQRLAASGAGFYAALTYDGEMSWSPGHQQDPSAVSSFNSHQRGEKGFGPALGPDAACRTAEIFSARGFDVTTAPSPWQIGPERKAAQVSLVDGIAAALRESAALPGDAIEDWSGFHCTPPVSGTCTVGHVDLLALPA